MKRILSIITVFALLFVACEGDQGPPGENGVNFVGQSFETGELDFLPENNFQQTINFPNDIELQDGDMILVYLLWDTEPTDIWRLLPQTIFTANGEFQYNFQDNLNNVTVFLDAPANFDFNTLLPGDTLNQVFRVVVLPIDFIQSNNIDTSDLSNVLEFGDLKNIVIK